MGEALWHGETRQPVKQGKLYGFAGGLLVPLNYKNEKHYL
jgi:hypothetical protein